MRTFKNLFEIETKKPKIEYYEIGYTKLYIYENIDLDEEILFSKRIKSLFKLCLYSEYLFFWFNSYDEMYEELNEYIELSKELTLKIIIIID